MMLSISSETFRRSLHDKKARGLHEIMRLVKATGFNAMELSFLSMHDQDYALAADDWENKVDELGKTAEENNLNLGQIDLPSPIGASFDLDPDFKKSGYLEFYKRSLVRAILAAARLHIGYVVLKPLTWIASASDRELQKTRNQEFFKPFIELAIRHGISVTVENMNAPSSTCLFTARYCQFHNELLDFVDSFNDDKIAVCWNTGNGATSKIDQGRAIRTCGDRLKTLHLSDNHLGGNQDYLLPYVGTVDWNDVLEALIAINYQGTLNYEVQGVIRHMPEELQTIMTPFIWNNAILLLGLYKELVGEVKL